MAILRRRALMFGAQATKKWYIQNGLVEHYDCFMNNGVDFDPTLKKWSAIVPVNTTLQIKEGSSNLKSAFYGFTEGAFMNRLVQLQANTHMGANDLFTFEIVITLPQSYVGDSTTDVTKNRLVSSSYGEQSDLIFWNAKDQKLKLGYRTNTEISVNRREKIYIAIKSIGQQDNIKMTVRTNDNDFPEFAGSTQNAPLIFNLLLNSGYESGNEALYSFRTYNRILTDEELNYNFSIDKERFNFSTDLFGYPIGVTDFTRQLDAIMNNQTSHLTKTNWRDIYSYQKGQTTIADDSGWIWGDNYLTRDESQGKTTLVIPARGDIKGSTGIFLVFQVPEFESMPPAGLTLFTMPNMNYALNGLVSRPRLNVNMTATELQAKSGLDTSFKKYPINPGDIVCLYTGGVSESQESCSCVIINGKRNRFGTSDGFVYYLSTIPALTLLNTTRAINPEHPFRLFCYHCFNATKDGHWSAKEKVNAMYRRVAERYNLPKLVETT